MTVGSLLRGGFGVIRAHPGAVAVWGALHLAFALIAMLLVMPMMGHMMAQMAAMTAAPDATPDLAAMQSVMGWMWLYDLAFFVLGIVIYAAAFRAVIVPGQPGFAFLKLGMDELLLGILAILFLIAACVAFVVATVVIVIITASLGYGVGATGVAVAVAIISAILLWCAAIWIEVRLSLAFPLTLMRGRLVVGEAWRVTRGRFWTLFGAYLVGALVIVVLSAVVFLPVMGSYFAESIHASGDPQRLNAVMQAQIARILHPGFGMIAIMVLGAAINAIAMALGGGMMATAAVELTGDADAIAAFA